MTHAPALSERDAGEISLEDDDLLLSSRAVKVGDLRSFDLSLGEGRAFLVLDGKGGGRLGAADADAGAQFLVSAARWLQVPVPEQTHAEPLRPLTFQYMPMGDEGGRRWEYNKAFFEQGGEYAELYINVSSDGHHVIFRPKDSGYAAPLIELFADALRDGPAPARTLANDPNLESVEPLFVLRKKGVPEVERAVCLSSGWVALVGGELATSVRHHPWGTEDAADWCSLPGEAQSVSASANGVVAIALVSEHPEARGVVSGKDASWLWSVGGGKCQRLPEKPRRPTLGPFDTVLAAPSGKELALEKDGVLLRIDVASGETSSVPLPKGSVWPYAWIGEAIWLKRLMEDRFVRVSRPKDAVSDEADPTLPSLDGRWSVTFLPKALEVRGKDGVAHRFTDAFRADRRALVRAREQLPPLLGPHQLVLDGSPQLALDLATLKTRPLVSTEVRLWCAAPDGKFALFRNERTGRYSVGERR